MIGQEIDYIKDFTICCGSISLISSHYLILDFSRLPILDSFFFVAQLHIYAYPKKKRANSCITYPSINPLVLAFLCHGFPFDSPPLGPGLRQVLRAQRPDDALRGTRLHRAVGQGLVGAADGAQGRQTPTLNACAGWRWLRWPGIHGISSGNRTVL